MIRKKGIAIQENIFLSSEEKHIFQKSFHSFFLSIFLLKPCFWAALSNLCRKQLLEQQKKEKLKPGFFQTYRIWKLKIEKSFTFESAKSNCLGVDVPEQNVDADDADADADADADHDHDGDHDDDDGDF